jgi:hypothetical protein
MDRRGLGDDEWQEYSFASPAVSLMLGVTGQSLDFATQIPERGPRPAAANYANRLQAEATTAWVDSIRFEGAATLSDVAGGEATQPQGVG